MRTRCPNCTIEYLIDADTLMAADGLACCYRCGTVFEAIGEFAVGPQTTGNPVLLDERNEAESGIPAATDETDLPFEVPANLAPLQPSSDAALDIRDSLGEKRSPRLLVYGALILLLAIALGLQLAWQYRAPLLDRFPQLQPLCDRLECVDNVVHAPDRLRVLQREMRPAPNQPGHLNLSVRFRNEAEAPQPLPDIQLSLLDNNGTVLIRRRLSPREYLYPPPSANRLIAPGEVLTTNIDFKDPGYLATGFMIDFL